MLVYGTFVLLCSTLVLTSTVNKTEHTDGFSKDTHQVVPGKIVHVTGGSSSASSSPNATVTSHKIGNVATIIGEGGPIYPADSQDSSDSSEYVSNTVSKITPMPVTPIKAIAENSDESSLTKESKSKLPKTRNASVVARKGAIPISKITARKGVGLEPPALTESSIEGIDEAISQVAPRAKNTSDKKIKPLGSQTANDTKTSSAEKKSTSKTINVDLSAKSTNNSASSVLHTSEKITTSPRTIKIGSTIGTKNSKVSSTSSSPPTKKFRPKPTVTIGEMDIDKPIPASPTKTPPLGMPRKIDYIVPVIITIMALPLLGAAAFFIYRRGRDCWDKRHYRRMDFLIDGMYNDYSWK